MCRTVLALLSPIPLIQPHLQCPQVPLGSDVFEFSGRDYASFHVGSNGYLTLGSGDFRFQSTVGSQNPKVLGSSAFASIETATVVTAFAEREEFDQETMDVGRRLQQNQFQTQALQSGATHWDLPRISVWFQVVNTIGIQFVAV